MRLKLVYKMSCKYIHNNTNVFTNNNSLYERTLKAQRILQNADTTYRHLFNYQIRLNSLQFPGKHRFFEEI